MANSTFYYHNIVINNLTLMVSYIVHLSLAYSLVIQINPELVICLKTCDMEFWL
jgi:hypothetical protein